MNYILYCRKSTDVDDKQVLSLESQEKELKDLAKREGLTIYKVLTESKSAKAPGRPVFNEMMQLIENGKADGILCWKIDRLTRNPIDGGKIQWLLNIYKIKVIRTFEKTYLPTDNILMMCIEQSMAQQYIRDLSTNVKRGNRAKLERGEWPNQPPFGYKNDKATKTVVVDEKRSSYVPHIFQSYLQGNSLKQVADEMYSRGLRSKSGKKIYASLMHRIISNSLYCGIMESNGKVYQGKHTPLISKTTYDNAKQLMNNASRPRPQKKFFPLSGFMTCEDCNCVYTAETKKGHTYYHCTNGKGTCTTKRTYTKPEQIYPQLANIFDLLHFSEELIEIMYQASKERLQSESHNSQATLDHLESLQNALRVKESRLLDVFLDGKMDQALYDEKSKQFKRESIDLTNQIERAKQQKPEVTLEPIKNIFLQASRAKKEFLEADETKKHNILKNLLWNLSMRNEMVASFKLRSPFDIIANAPKTSDFLSLLPDLDSNQDTLLQRE